MGAVAGLLAASSATWATDGYFSNGYGIKSKGRAGVAQTSTDDAFGAANNPATLSFAEDRVDVGIDWFMPTRSAERTGPAIPLNGKVTSDHDHFFIPELGYRQALNEQWSVGLAIYGNGGMNTDYQSGQLNLGPGATEQNLLAGPGRLGVNLSQLLIAPGVSWKFAEGHAIGLAPVIAYQRFEAYGLGAFAGISQDATAMTDSGTDHSWGGGVRLGYLWNVSTTVSLGASYSSRVYATGFDRYRGLFAGDGTFDIPQSVAVGLGWQATSAVRLGLDYKWIDNASIPAVGNSSSRPGALGLEDGPGFGWRSISVVKAGVDWALCDSFVLRGGYGFAENPVRSEDVTFNIVAPGVIQHHLTFGATYKLGRHEISAAYMHAFENSVSGESKFVAFGMAPAGTRETVRMSQDSVGIQYSWKF